MYVVDINVVRLFSCNPTRTFVGCCSDFLILPGFIDFASTEVVSDNKGRATGKGLCRA